MNTGQLYVLDGDDNAASPHDPSMPTSGLVTDVIQGRQLSLDEFEQVLGLNAVLEVGHTALSSSWLHSECIGGLQLGHNNAYNGYVDPC